MSFMELDLSFKGNIWEAKAGASSPHGSIEKGDKRKLFQLSGLRGNGSKKKEQPRSNRKPGRRSGR